MNKKINELTFFLNTLKYISLLSIFFCTSFLLNATIVGKIQSLQELTSSINALENHLAQLAIPLSPLSPSTPLDPVEPLEPNKGAVYMSFDDWYKKSISLPYSKLITTGGELKAYVSRAEFLPKEQMLNLIDQFIDVNKNILANQKNWLQDAPKQTDIFFTTEKPLDIYQPFVQKLIVPEGAQVAFHGDFKADQLSLAKYIKALQDLNYLEGFKIVNPKEFYLVFLGNYVDRGAFGTEVWYMLMRLKIENPENVILLRGRHENSEENKLNGFQREFELKYPAIKWEKIARIYDLLPDALFLGSGTSFTNYLLCTNGGIETKFNPQNLLTKEGEIAFSWLKFFDDEFPASSLENGFLWNHFNLDPKEKTITKEYTFTGSKERKVMITSMSKDDTKHYFTLINHSKLSSYSLQGVFRGTQNIGGIMKALIPAQGVLKLWPEDQRSDNKLWSNSVTTFLISPDTSYGANYKFIYDTFGILTTAQKFENWILDVYNNPNVFNTEVKVVKQTPSSLHKPEKPLSRVTFDEPSFNEWYIKCKKLPLFREIGTNYQHKALEWEELQKAIDDFMKVNKALLNSSQKWIEDAPSPSDPFFIQLDSPLNPIKPFVQKLIVKPETKIAFHGDFHGDVHAMVEYIQRLNTENYLDGFTIKDPNFYLIFLGDYEDRGIYGTEVWYTLMRLKITNPHQVLIVRGNHEDQDLTWHYGFDKEFKTKFNSENLNKFLRIFDFLPVALYVGTGSVSLKNYLLCIHGGLETNFDANTLLSASGSDLYQWLKLSDSTPLSFPKIGFMWNDFQITAQKATNFNTPRGIKYGKQDTEKYFADQSSKEKGFILKGIFRAHQHSGIPGEKLMKAMLDGKGVAKLWPDETNKNKNLWNNIVCTFLVGPDTIFGKAHNYNWDGFGILTMAENFEDWNLQMLVNNIIPTQKI